MTASIARDEWYNMYIFIKKSLLILILAIFVGLLFQNPISTHVKVLLLITEEFEQIPIKLLRLVTKAPAHKTLVFESKVGKVNADLFVAQQKGQTPALVVAMGVKTAEKDRPIILHFAETMSRLGYVVLWPRLAVLDKGQSLSEEPSTFIEGFRYLEGLDVVNKERISFVGFSTGSSIAMVAAQDSSINNSVHGLVFFGGYYDIFDYLTSLATKRIVADGQGSTWEPAEGATSHAKEILMAKKAEKLLAVFETQDAHEVETILTSATDEELDSLRKLNPKENLSNFTSRIFILHDKADPYVPYVESVKLSEALPSDVTQTFTLVSLFEHVQPKKGFSFDLLGEFVKLYRFLYEALWYL